MHRANSSTSTTNATRSGGSSAGEGGSNVSRTNTTSSNNSSSPITGACGDGPHGGGGLKNGGGGGGGGGVKGKVEISGVEGDFYKALMALDNQVAFLRSWTRSLEVFVRLCVFFVCGGDNSLCTCMLWCRRRMRHHR